MKPTPSHVEWFRSAAPYIHAHRGRTFIIQFAGEASDDESLIHDVALLNSLGTGQLDNYSVGKAPVILFLIALCTFWRRTLPWAIVVTAFSLLVWGDLFILFLQAV